ncbi:hypothetical protein B296_00036528 [Ensete ventricosum]|uniref:Cytochrome P450 n=1 Tax=Ensete ventricosum TaxID=4639 RepID=A0A426Y7L1_ENSVE|nr:hypothetical protein B296_00036528 [Ensete ventricosum]
MPMSEFATAFDTASRLLAMLGTTTTPLIWKLKRLLNVGSKRELKREIRMINMLAEEVIQQRRKITVCLGKELALMEMKTVIVSVVSKFDVEVFPSGWSLKFVPGLTATINGGLPAWVCRPKI